VAKCELYSSDLFSGCRKMSKEHIVSSEGLVMIAVFIFIFGFPVLFYITELGLIIFLVGLVVLLQAFWQWYNDRRLDIGRGKVSLSNLISTARSQRTVSRTPSQFVASGHCVNCGFALSQFARFCPNCGANQSPRSNRAQAGKRTAND